MSPGIVGLVVVSLVVEAPVAGCIYSLDYDIHHRAEPSYGCYFVALRGGIPAALLDCPRGLRKGRVRLTVVHCCAEL